MLFLSSRIFHNHRGHDELTSAKAPGTTLNSTEATAAMSWSFIVLLVVVDDVVVLFLMQIKNYEIKLSYK